MDWTVANHLRCAYVADGDQVMRSEEEVDEAQKIEVDPWVDSHRACARVVEAGLWLLSNGWGRMQILPYIAPSGCYWRCEFHPTGKPGLPFFRYSSSAGFRFLENHCGGTVRKNIGADALAKAIIVSVPEAIRTQCEGPASFETLLWHLKLIDHLDRKLLPAAFQEYTEDFSRWGLWGASGTITETMEPQPGYVPPGQEDQWFETDFWRGTIEAARRLEDEDGFLVNLNDATAVDRIASELAIVLREIDSEQASTAFKAAVAKLAGLRAE